jgi:glycosyl transferase family 1
MRKGTPERTTVLLATDCRFWQADIGSRQRILSLCAALADEDLDLQIFFVGELSLADLGMLRKRCEGLAGCVIPHTPPRWCSRYVRGGVHRWLAIARRVRGGTQPRKEGRSLGSTRGNQPLPVRPWMEPGLDSFFSRSAQARFQRIAGRIQPDFVLIEYIRLAYLVANRDAFLPDSTVTIIDTLDVMSSRCRKFHEHGEPHWVGITESEEAKVLASFDVVMAIQRDEAAQFRRMVPRGDIITAGHVSPMVRNPFRVAEILNVTYIAAEGRANEDALRWFLHEVWCAISKRFGRAVCFQIVGAVGSELDPRRIPPSAVVRGRVESLASVYYETDIVVNPVRYGGGLKIKSVEALCNAKPLLSTSVGVEGLEHGAETAFHVSDTANQMIDKLAALVESPSMREDTGAHAYQFALSNFTPEAAYGQLYRKLCPR